MSCCLWCICHISWLINEAATSVSTTAWVHWNAQCQILLFLFFLCFKIFMSLFNFLFEFVGNFFFQVFNKVWFSICSAINKSLCDIDLALFWHLLDFNCLAFTAWCFETVCLSYCYTRLSWICLGVWFVIFEGHCLAVLFSCLNFYLVLFLIVESLIIIWDKFLLIDFTNYSTSSLRVLWSIFLIFCIWSLASTVIRFLIDHSITFYGTINEFSITISLLILIDFLIIISLQLIRIKLPFHHKKWVFWHPCLILWVDFILLRLFGRRIHIFQLPKLIWFASDRHITFHLWTQILIFLLKFHSMNLFV